MAACDTNTIHMVLPEGANIAEIRQSFECFGEVCGVELLPEEPQKVAVAFFDVRSAAQAIEALGSAYCANGPQTGSRTVRLAGEAQFDPGDFSGVSGVHADEAEDGAFVIEFFDFRDAARYKGEVRSDRVLAPPPGLEQAPSDPSKEEDLSSPPGLSGAATAAFSAPAPPPGLEQPPAFADEASSATTSVCSVRVSGIPNKLLTEPMMEAILEQAGLEYAVVDFTTKTGRPCGEVTVGFSCELAAQRCISHFQQCQWDQSGKQVSAELIESKAAAWPFEADLPMFDAAAQEVDFAAFRQMLEADVAGVFSSEASSHSSADASTSTGLSAEAPVWVPGNSLSAEAAPFVPGCLNEEKALSRKSGMSKRRPGAGSDTSTEIGESEDEKDCPKFDSPAMVL